MISTGYSMAPRLHRWVRSVFSLCAAGIACTSAACIIPPSLEVEVNDAGVSSPPVVRSAASPFEFPGPFTVTREATDVSISLTLRDNDLDDTLFVRLFLDYDPESGAGLISDCVSAPTGERDRVLGCPINTVCSLIEVGDTSLHTLEAMVTDRLWLTAGDPDAVGQPPLRAVDVNAGAGDSIRGWTMRCE